MKLDFLYKLGGEISRRDFLLAGVLLFFVKFGIDMMVATMGFQQAWSPQDYLYYLNPVGGIAADAENGDLFRLVLIAVALPFIFVGINLTLKRLRSAGLSPFLSFLFFLPAVNLLFFSVLAMLPAKSSVPKPLPQWITRRIPSSALPAAATSCFAVLPITLLGVFGFATVMGTYGGGVFLAMPFAVGMLSVMIFSAREERGFAMCMLVAFAAATLVGFSILLVAIEGAICLLMAAPIGYALALLGGMFGYMLQAGVHNSGRFLPSGSAGLLLAFPMLMGAEYELPGEPELHPVVSQILINASPETVWQNVVTFSDLAPPEELYFQLGAAYPLRARIEGSGVGAVRYCEFSTGPFVEPITTWDEPTHLAFDVRSQPPTMEELSPYEIKPQHLNDYLVSKKGEFRLTRQADGSTLLEGTTWYMLKMAPSSYWHMWSDFFIHRIHLRVLRHIKALSEAA